MNFISKALTFFKEVRVEIKKVNWPGRDKTIRYTLIVIAVSVAVAIFLGGLDFVFTMILDTFVI